jgi:hypothetical protein
MAAKAKKAKKKAAKKKRAKNGGGFGLSFSRKQA